MMETERLILRRWTDADADSLFEYAKKKVLYDIDPDKAIGLDMSMHAFYVDSNGNTVDTPHPYLRSQDRLAKEQRKLSHMKKGSSNYRKQKQKI